MNRIEGGVVNISYTDLKALLNLYNVNDAQAVEELAEMAEVARARPPAEYIDAFDKPFRRYLEDEQIADHLRQFENAYVPGLLQTRRYAHAMLEAAYKRKNIPLDNPRISAEVDKKVDYRLARRDIFDTKPGEEGALRGEFVMDEGAIRRMVGAESGDKTVMVEQLEYLKEVRHHPLIGIAVIPFSAGTHLGMSGPFVLLNFPDPDFAPLLYMEDAREDFASTDHRELTREFSDAFSALEAVAVRGDELDALLDDALDSMIR
jgi:hypothetical protein